jgi:hypothetical protein
MPCIGEETLGVPSHEIVRGVMRRLSVLLNAQPAMTVTRASVASERLVYLIVLSKRIKYPFGTSRIAYIGTTKKGVRRLATSMSTKAERALRKRGVRDFAIRVVTCKGRQRVQTWRKLERGLLLTFRERYGAVPEFNVHGTKMRRLDEFGYFSEARLRRILQDIGAA